MKRLINNLYFCIFITFFSALALGFFLSAYKLPLLAVPAPKTGTAPVVELFVDECSAAFLPFLYQSDLSTPPDESQIIENEQAPAPDNSDQTPETPETDPPSQTESVTSIPEGALPIKMLTVRPASYMQGIQGVYVKNEAEKEFNLEQLLNNPVKLGLDRSSDDPQILIVHTHATESFNEEGSDYYLPQTSYRSDDDSKNMVHIGDVMAQMLTQAGYRVLHTSTHHDVDFNKSYTSSYNEISDYLEQYPSIKVVLDVHRDSIITDSGVKYRTVTEIDGQQSSQVMLLMGCGNDTYQHPEWEQNFTLAAHIQKTAAEKYPDLMRPILLRAARYNEHLSTGSLLVEVGTCGNTLQEAERGARYFTEVLIEVLNQAQ